ncbi:hypothetical protein LU699_16810 [Luteimonas fraxinea]|uniref:Adenylate cyclase n=1 Tax=Luteimonas fraxinea TaxID=2901869 RepID=A0ABS8UCZ2_9GAMM|nr:hypothetical protein [Luteimonas fraxinea]MCD9096755.1 hypothetical protein [Luteimonas fraxinea]MCD9126124.1 hypothetical protein [Luteimonas fraxinea]UHH09896.1 hypothetical protein LU699_16810 [Luteimonas fraxinea]
MYPPDRLTASTISGAAALPRHRTVFFPAMALLLLATVLAGFWNTFFFRDAAEGPLALHLHLHGFAVTAWFVLFATQSLLVANGRIALHRRLGVLGAVIALCVVVTSLVTLAQLVHSWRAQGVDVDAQRPLLSLIIWGDSGALTAYVVFLVRGLLLRRRADAHRRLMLLASLAIISPALIRLADLPVFGGVDGVLITIGGLLALAIVLVVYDLTTLRRIHRETLWGAPFFLVVHLAPAFLMPGTAADTWLMALLW